MSDSVKKWHEMNEESFENIDVPIDPIVMSVINKFKVRSRQGTVEYGTTLYDNPDGFYRWINEAQSEAMDFILYLEKIKNLNK